MISDLLKRLTNSADRRTQRAQINILLSASIKGCSILVSLLLVPVTLKYLNNYEYGVWLTLSSIIMWINYFDIGLGNGLRNKLAEALARDDYELGQKYVSTTVAILSIIIVSIYLIYFAIHPFLSWNKILNVPEGQINTDLDKLVLIILAFFSLSFILKFIGNVYLAKQLSVINDFLGFCGNVISLSIIYILTITTEGNLSYVAITFTCVPVIVYLIAYPITFHKYKELKPKFSAINFKYSSSLLSLGGQFFIIQIACLVVFSTSNFFIAQLCSPADVTIYNIAFKYFSIVNMAFVIVITPFWSAATEAYIKKDIIWIKRSVKMILKFFLLLVCVSLIMLFLSNYIYQLWVQLSISFSLSCIMMVYVTIVNWNNLYAYFLNGIGKIRIQLYCSILSSIILIPLAIILGRLWGIIGICVSMCIALSTSAIALPLQYRSIIKKKDI